MNILKDFILKKQLLTLLLYSFIYATISYLTQLFLMLIIWDPQNINKYGYFFILNQMLFSLLFCVFIVLLHKALIKIMGNIDLKRIILCTVLFIFAIYLLNYMFEFIEYLLFYKPKIQTNTGILNLFDTFSELHEKPQFRPINNIISDAFYSLRFSFKEKPIRFFDILMTFVNFKLFMAILVIYYESIYTNVNNYIVQY